jgi:hypothetical protein
LCCPFAVSATLLGFIYPSSLLDICYESKDHWPDPEAVVEAKRSLFGTLVQLLTRTWRSLTQDVFRPYFWMVALYCVV